MKPSLSLKETVLDNSDLFKTDFYDRFTLAPHHLQLTDSISKRYLFPTFYGNVTQSVGIFLCSYDRAKKLLPHQNLFPVKMGFGRTLVIFSCYEYKNVHQIATYNEIAMTIPVMANPLVNIPLLPMVMSSVFKKFGYYVFSMPVTSLENQIRGQKIWGLPKIVQQIALNKKDGYHTTEAFEETGEKYFELKVPVSGKPTELDDKGYLYTRLDNSMLRAQTCFKGRFFINKNMKCLVSGRSSDEDFLKIYDTESGNKLKQLEIDSRPFQFRYAENVSSCFDLPDTESKVFMDKNF